MATAAKHLARSAQRQFRASWTPRPTTQRIAQRNFSSSIVYREEEEAKKSQSQTYFNQTFFNTLDADDRASYRGYSESERQQMEKVANALKDEFARDSRTHRELEDAVKYELDALDQEFPEEVAERAPRNDGFFQMGEKEDIGPDEDDFLGDDISSTGHGELEQQREIREYARLAGWEMPLLAKLAKPFQPPTAATPLRFRYTTYMGESHPASRKVVLEVDISDLNLPSAQQSNLIKLAGPRYNPNTNIIKMSCEDHETQAQNKRALGDTLSALLASAKDPSNAEFLGQIPVDFRHVKQKKKLQFPEEWLLTEERKAELDARRQQRKTAEQQKAETPLGLVDGIKEIEEARNIALNRVEAPVMAEARQPMAKGKQGKKQMLAGRA